MAVVNMDSQLLWHWDLEPFSTSMSSNEELINIEEVLITGENKDTAVFSSFNYPGSSTGMKVIKGNMPLSTYNYHCWTIFIENKSKAEIMIGIATEDCEFSTRWNEQCRLGCDEKSWALSSGGYLCHKSQAILHEEWRFFTKDHVTVYLNGLQRTLSFAINGKHIGSEYIDVPTNCILYPVIGSTMNSSLRLVSNYSCHFDLQLMSFLSHSYFMTSIEGKAPTKKVKSPRNFRILWLKPSYLKRTNIPPGLRAALKRNYPWFFTKTVHRTRVRPRRWKHPAMKLTYQYPRSIRLLDPFCTTSTTPLQNRRKGDQKCSKSTSISEKCLCKSCSHKPVLRFLRSRTYQSYSSSSSSDEDNAEGNRTTKRIRLSSPVSSEQF